MTDYTEHPDYAAVDASLVVLKKFKRIAYTAISSELAKYFSEPCMVDIAEHWLDDIMLRVVQPMWGETLDKIEVRYPADWWEAFKERWLPRWAKKRWPIRYTVKTMTARGVYPKLSMPDEEHRVYLDVHQKHDT